MPGLLTIRSLQPLVRVVATDTGPSTDAVNRHALVRVPAPEPDWPALKQRLAGATSAIKGIELGQADKQGLRMQIPVADGFASGLTYLGTPERSFQQLAQLEGSFYEPALVAALHKYLMEVGVMSA